MTIPERFPLTTLHSGTSLFACVLTLLLLPNLLQAQIRVTPENAQGGTPQDPAWTHVPETMQAYLETVLPPEWPLPETLEEWTDERREETREILIRQLGDLPLRPDVPRVRILSIEQHDGYTLERFEFHNGVDMIVPGILMIPDELEDPAPAIVGLHGHGSSKESIGGTHVESSQHVGPDLVREGYVVAAIDSYFNGERIGKGPAGTSEDKRQQEWSQFKLHNWLGRTLWGLMLRDEQMLLDYLETRPEVDADRIAATGMSMGATRSWWLAAIDDRIRAIVSVACFTRYTELIQNGALRSHGIYYFVPGILKHFDTEAIYSLVAPRPMLQLSGDQDAGAPTRGIEVLEEKLAHMYKLYGEEENFRSVLYHETGHEYLPEMKEEMLEWFRAHLPVDGP